MIPVVNVNFVAVLIAAIAQMLLGMFWYSPMGFGKLWMKLSGKKQSDIVTEKEKMPLMFGLAFVSSVLIAYGLAHVMGFAGAKNVVDALQIAFWSWLTFVATVTLGMVLWDGKPLKLYLLINAYNLLSFMISAAILVSWK